MISPQISIGPLTFHLYGFIIAIAIYLGWTLVKKRAHLYKISPKIFDDPFLLIPLILGIIGARLYHVLDFWSYYRENPSQIIAITNGGLGIWGALAGIFAGLGIFARIKKINFLSLLDLTASSILLGQALGRIGNYVNQEGFGPPTNLPWSVYIAPENRPVQFLTSTHFHPTFFYEAILDLIFFLLLLYLSSLSFPRPLLSFPRKRESRVQPSSGFSIRSRMTVEKPGQVFALYLIFYSTARFIAELWRIDTWTLGEVKIAHLLAAATFFIGFLLLSFTIFRAKLTNNP